MTEDTFLESIQSEPDEDAHRLVYADWIDDNGDTDRAEFIRAQVRRSRSEDDSARLNELYHCERELLAQHEDTWLEPFQTFLRPVHLHRGFVHKVEEELGNLASIPSSPWPMGALRALALRLPGQPIHLECLQALANRRDFRSLEALILFDGVLPPGGLIPLAGSPYLRTLGTLVIRSAALGGPGLDDLLTGEWPCLRTLRLINAGLNTTALARLLISPVFNRLAVLDLRGNPLGAEGLRLLAEEPKLKHLEQLALSRPAPWTQENAFLQQLGVRLGNRLTAR